MVVFMTISTNINIQKTVFVPITSISTDIKKPVFLSISTDINEHKTVCTDINECRTEYSGINEHKTVFIPISTDINASIHTCLVLTNEHKPVFFSNSTDINEHKTMFIPISIDINEHKTTRNVQFCDCQPVERQDLKLPSSENLTSPPCPLQLYS